MLLTGADSVSSFFFYNLAKTRAEAKAGVGWGRGEAPVDSCVGAVVGAYGDKTMSVAALPLMMPSGARGGLGLKHATHPHYALGLQDIWFF
jgi:hypothetical protein